MAFYGTWDNRYWKNTPGPIYSTTDNLLSLIASGDSPSHILFDEECEFIWRQPDNPLKRQECLDAVNMDEVASYQIDGDKHWTPELVRSWWKHRDELLSWARANLTFGQGDAAGHWKRYPEIAARRQIADYIQFLEHGMEEYLRRYIFLLENNRESTGSDNLPPI